MAFECSIGRPDRSVDGLRCTPGSRFECHLLLRQTAQRRNGCAVTERAGNITERFKASGTKWRPFSERRHRAQAYEVRLRSVGGRRVLTPDDADRDDRTRSAKETVG